MDSFLILIALALALTVLHRAATDLVPVHAPAVLTRTLAVALGAGLAWMLDYSVFSAFGQDLRAEWMHPVLTGLVLVAIGEFIRSLVNALSGRTGGAAVESSSPKGSVRTA